MNFTVEHKLTEEQQAAIEEQIADVLKYADQRVDDIREYAEAGIQNMKKAAIALGGVGLLVGFLSGLIVGHVTAYTEGE